MTVATVRPDPLVRVDGRCVVCHGPRGRLPKSAHLSKVNLAELRKHLDADPFCSNPCARLWHGILISGSPEKAPSSDLDWTHA